MKELFQKFIDGRVVLLFFIITNLVYAFILFETIPGVMRFSDGMMLMDMLPAGYNIDYVRKLLNTLGEEGRNEYLYRQIPTDMIYPLLFGISYSLLLAYFLSKINMINSTLVYLCLLPLVAGIFDYLENIGIIVMLTSYPELTESTVVVTNTFTLFKSVATTIYFLVLPITVGVWMIRTLKKQTISENQ